MSQDPGTLPLFPPPRLIRAGGNEKEGFLAAELEKKILVKKTNVGQV